jgi:hypothetical protein
MHPFHPLDEKVEVIFDIYTSDGKLSIVQPSIEVRQCILLCIKFSAVSAPPPSYTSPHRSPISQAVFDFADNRIYSTNTTYDLLGPAYASNGELSCEASNVPYDASEEVRTMPTPL